MERSLFCVKLLGATWDPPSELAQSRGSLLKGPAFGSGYGRFRRLQEPDRSP